MAKNDLTPTITKFILTDPQAVSPEVEIQAGIYITGGADGPRSVVSQGWSAGWFIAPGWKDIGSGILIDLGTGKKPYLFYTGHLEGEAEIIMTTDTGEVVSYYRAPEGKIVENISLRIADNVARIGVSSKSPAVMELVLGFFPETDITEDVESWHGMETILTRDGTTGVIPEVTFPINMVRKARAMITQLFETYGMYAKADFNVYKRDNWDLDRYDRIAAYHLDFSTYRDFDRQTEIEGLSADLNQYINSFASTKWDIPVADVAMDHQWHYRRMDMLNVGNYKVAETDLYPTNTNVYRWPVSMVNAEMTPGGPEHDFKDQTLGSNKSDYFFKAAAAVDVRISIKLSYKHMIRHVEWDASDLPVRISIMRGGNEIVLANYIPPITRYVKWVGNYTIFREIDINASFFTHLEKDDQLVIYSVISKQAISNQTLSITSFELFTVEYVAKATEAVRLNVIDPRKLMQRLLDDATGKPGHFAVEINWGDISYLPAMCAAETVRGFVDAAVHTSIDEFLNYMRYSGYEYEVLGNRMVYRPRDEFFPKDKTAMLLDEGEMADLVIAANKDHAYTAVRLGWTKPDYEKYNGRFEVNGAFDYTTDYTARDENMLDWVIPYRADSMGLEILLQDRNKVTTDTKSDNDLFVIALDKTVVTEDIGTTEDPATREVYYEYLKERIRYGKFPTQIFMFNAPLCPPMLVAANESFLGINAKNLRFAGTDSNKNKGEDDDKETARIVDSSNRLVLQIYKDWKLTKKLYDPVKYNFAAGTYQPFPIESLRTGLIYFTCDGRQRKGFIDEITKNDQKESETSWTLNAVLD